MALYFKLFLILPLLLGLLAIVIPGSEHIAILSFSSTLLFVTGLPYFVFVAAAWVWSSRKGKKRYSFAMLLSPFVFGILVFIYRFVFDFIFNANNNNLQSEMGSWFLMAGIATIIAAIYAWPALLAWHFIMLVRRKPKPE